MLQMGVVYQGFIQMQLQYSGVYQLVARGIIVNDSEL